jgi:RNase P subunit RPR2
MYALALPHETLADAIAEALAPARAAQVRSGVLGGTCLVCGGVTRIAAHAGVRSASCVECESVLEAPLPTRLRLVSHPE